MPVPIAKEDVHDASCEKSASIHPIARTLTDSLVTLEMVLEEELKAMVGARRFERVGSRKDHRNGTYLRQCFR